MFEICGHKRPARTLENVLKSAANKRLFNGTLKRLRLATKTVAKLIKQRGRKAGVTKRRVF
jgi:hypothetical protein